MDLQTIFNEAVAHMVKQGTRSRIPGGGMCAYRSPGGLKCAVGYFIPDENYSPQLEGKGASQPQVVKALPQEIVATARALELLDKLQTLHDDRMPGRHFNLYVKQIALHFNLDIPAAKLPDDVIWE